MIGLHYRNLPATASLIVMYNTVKPYKMNKSKDESENVLQYIIGPPIGRSHRLR